MTRPRSLGLVARWWPAFALGLAVLVIVCIRFAAAEPVVAAALGLTLLNVVLLLGVMETTR